MIVENLIDKLNVLLQTVQKKIGDARRVQGDQKETEDIRYCRASGRWGISVAINTELAPGASLEKCKFIHFIYERGGIYTLQCNDFYEP